MKNLIILITMVSSNAFANQVYDQVTEKQPVCYGREYGIDHLKSTPLQKVQKIQVKLEKIDKYNQNNLSVEVTLRGAKNEFINYRAGFVCNAANHCYIECDGGQAVVSMNADGKLVLENRNFVLAGGCGSDEKTVLLNATQGGDDVFVMSKLPPEMCQTTNAYDL